MIAPHLQLACLRQNVAHFFCEHFYPRRENVRFGDVETSMSTTSTLRSRRDHEAGEAGDIRASFIRFELLHGADRVPRVARSLLAPDARAQLQLLILVVDAAITIQITVQMTVVDAQSRRLRGVELQTRWLEVEQQPAVAAELYRDSHRVARLQQRAVRITQQRVGRYLEAHEF